MVMPVLSRAANSTVVFRLVATTFGTSNPMVMHLHACGVSSTCWCLG